MIAFKSPAHRPPLAAEARHALLLALAMLLGLSASAAAVGENRSKLWDSCRTNDGEGGLAACMAIINTRGIATKERGTAYYNRCYKYMLRHDYRRALTSRCPPPRTVGRAATAACERLKFAASSGIGNDEFRKIDPEGLQRAATPRSCRAAPRPALRRR